MVAKRNKFPVEPNSWSSFFEMGDPLAFSNNVLLLKQHLKVSTEDSFGTNILNAVFLKNKKEKKLISLNQPTKWRIRKLTIFRYYKNTKKD